MNVIRPPALREGDEIRIVAPASAPDMNNLSKGISRLRKMGYRVTLGRNIKKLVQRNSLAAPDRERMEELVNAFRDDNVKAIFCARGGYGSIHILPLIDYDVIRDHPKIFLGYSDITALHLAINKMTGLVTFHGPMPASDPNEMAKPTYRHFLDILSGRSNDINPYTERVIKYIVSGRAEGRSMGTNLSVTASLIGTSYMPDPEGRILFVEDTGVTSGDVDRYFFSMKLAGMLPKFAGFVFGEFESIKDIEEPMPFVEDVIQIFMNEVQKPSLYGMPFGHGDDQMLIPLNSRIKISTDEPYLEMLEDVVD
ncbi:putative murein peptide carboxypeptidase [Thermogymnomonas acidicola]|uniref:Murein peptide carboxypeptidase n=1 Tax=Thermogymnomonas acidicola TaxID=399579 RepID=A0AA37F8K7_9ARCH|nr:LD-carboxypeptidase [Thermogymnomonas acidicola]GGM66492.1 putative murein peptide carboxypeptidase [Thermogymnomonas acidicola]